MDEDSAALLQDARGLAGEHAELADVAARVRTAIERRDALLTRALLITLQVLEEAHYRNEGDLMQRIAYDDFARHHEEHAELIGALQHINRTLALEHWGAVSEAVAAHLERAASHQREADERLLQFVARGAHPAAAGTAAAE